MGLSRKGQRWGKQLKGQMLRTPTIGLTIHNQVEWILSVHVSFQKNRIWIHENHDRFLYRIQNKQLLKTMRACYC